MSRLPVVLGLVLIIAAGSLLWHFQATGSRMTASQYLRAVSGQRIEKAATYLSSTSPQAQCVVLTDAAFYATRHGIKSQTWVSEIYDDEDERWVSFAIETVFDTQYVHTVHLRREKLGWRVLQTQRHRLNGIPVWDGAALASKMTPFDRPWQISAEWAYILGVSGKFNLDACEGGA